MNAPETPPPGRADELTLGPAAPAAAAGGWPSGLTRLDLLSLDPVDRKAIANALRMSLAHTTRARDQSVRGREYAFKRGNPADEARHKAQADAYARGQARLRRLIAVFS